MSNFYRSNDEKVIAGACAGIAQKSGRNVTRLRWIAAVLTLFGCSCDGVCDSLGAFKRTIDEE